MVECANAILDIDRRLSWHKLKLGVFDLGLASRPTVQVHIHRCVSVTRTFRAKKKKKKMISL